jgi:HEAT repeat protein
MTELPEDLRVALDSDDAEEFGQLLRRRRPEDFQALQQLLSPDLSIPPDHRTKALYALGRWGDPSVVPVIRRLLPELDERGRISALSALGHLETSEAVAAILEHADDRSPQVRKAAAVALARSTRPDAHAKLQELAANDPVPWIRHLAARHIS